MKLKYLGTTPHTFELPIPFISAKEKVGEVVCDPVGDFPAEAAAFLLATAPGAFEQVEDEATPAAAQHAINSVESDALDALTTETLIDDTSPVYKAGLDSNVTTPVADDQPSPEATPEGDPPRPSRRKGRRPRMR